MPFAISLHMILLEQRYPQIMEIAHMVPYAMSYNKVVRRSTTNAIRWFQPQPETLSSDCTKTVLTLPLLLDFSHLMNPKIV